MANRFIVVGDSHTATFRPFDASIAAIYQPGALTMDAFCRPEHELTLAVGEFFKTINPDIGTLVLCMSEVDIRVHYWRDLPLLLSRGMTIQDVVVMKVRAFVERATAVCQHFGFPRFILWGAPASNVGGAAVQGDFPITGDNVTRNILTHMFSSTCIDLARAGHPLFRFATLFYDMVSDDFVTDPTWLADGIHLTNAIKPLCLSRLAPIVAGDVTAVAGDRMARLRERTIDLATVPVTDAGGTNASLARRGWLETPGEPQIRLDEARPGFSFVQDVGAAARREPVQELVLRSRHAARL